MSFKTDFPNILPDFITPRNFLFFLISKEYIEYSSNVKCFNELIDEETKFTFYQFLFKASKDASIDIFKFVKETDNPFKRKLNSLVIKRIEMILNNLNDLISYNDILELVNNVLSPFHERVDVIGNEGRGKICKYSLIGAFLKKFSLSFQSLSMEKIIMFIESFRQVLQSYDIIPQPNKICRSSESSESIDKLSLLLKRERCSEDQVRWSLENIHNDIENVLYDRHLDRKRNATELRQQLAKYKRMYPDIAESFFLDNLLTMHHRDLELVEKDIQTEYPGKYLGSADSGHRELAAAVAALHQGQGGQNQHQGQHHHHQQQQDSSGTGSGGGAGVNRDIGGSGAKKKQMLVQSCEIRQKMSEVSLNSVITFSAMGFKDEAMMHFRDAIFNAKLSRRTDLLAEVGSVGNSLMPINDNPSGTFSSRTADAGSSLSDKTALGNIRDVLLLSLHSNRHSLAELLHQYFCSTAPQRREISAICLVYLSIIFRSFGFEGMANSYLIIAAGLESIKRTKNHQEVLVETFCQLISSYAISGRFERAQQLFKSLRALGDGILCANNEQLQAVWLQTSFSHSLMRLDFSRANRCLEKLQHVSLAEYGLRKVQMLFMEDNNAAAIRLANHVISFATRKRELLVYNHVSISRGRATTSSQIPHHRSSGIVDHLSEMTFLRDLPSLDDASSQNWGSRDWAIYECRCRWLMCTQLINRQQLKTAQTHLDTLQALSTKFHFYQFQRLSQVLQLALTSRGANECRDSRLQYTGNNQQQQQQTVQCPLQTGISNRQRSQTILSSKVGLSPRNYMVFVNLLVNLFVSQPGLSRDLRVESHLAELADYCEHCGDCMGQAHCWQMRYRYYDAIGNEEEKSRALFELELLLENKLTHVPNLDFLCHVL